jgi:hypothetical protein
MNELTNFMDIVSIETTKIQKIQEEKEKRLIPKINVNKSLGDFFAIISEERKPSRISTPINSSVAEELVEIPQLQPVKIEKHITEQDNVQRIDILKTFFNRLDDFEKSLEEKTNVAAGHIYADKMTNHLPKKQELNEIQNIRREFNHFRKLVSQQMSTIGGGGAVNLLDLDDIDTSSLGNGKFLVYNSTSGKLEFTDQVDGN